MEINVSADKKNIRRELKDIRSKISIESKKEAGDRLCKAIIDDELFINSKNMLIFASLGSEIPTWPLINKALEIGKNVFLPKVEGSNLVFYKIQDMLDLVKGYKGIAEPDGGTDRFDNGDYLIDESFIIIPGLGYDSQGNRIGYGGGYYDRFLNENPALNSKSIAVGFKEQMVTHIPTAAHDVKPNRVLLV